MFGLSCAVAICRNRSTSRSAPAWEIPLPAGGSRLSSASSPFWSMTLATRSTRCVRPSRAIRCRSEGSPHDPGLIETNVAIFSINLVARDIPSDQQHGHTLAAWIAGDGLVETCLEIGDEDRLLSIDRAGDRDRIGGLVVDPLYPARHPKSEHDATSQRQAARMCHHGNGVGGAARNRRAAEPWGNDLTHAPRRMNPARAVSPPFTAW